MPPLYRCLRPLGVLIAAALPLVSAALAPARADPPPEGDGATLLRQSGQALAKVRALRFTAAREGVGDLSTRSPLVAGSVVINEYRHGEPLSAWKFAVRASFTPTNATEPQRIETVFDGDKAIMIRHADKTVLEGPAAAVPDMLAEGGQFLISVLTNWSALVDRPVLQRAEAPARRIGVRTVAGVPCDVVQIDLQATGRAEYLVWVFIAQTDRLPRRLEALYTDPATGVGVLSLSDLVADAPPDPGALSWSLPRDYDARPYVPRMTAPSDPARAGPPKIGQPMPAWSLKAFDGAAVRSADLAGSVYVLDFWATWCPPCLAAMPGIEKLHREFQGRPVRFFGVNCWENADARALVQREKFTYAMLEAGDDLAKQLGVSAIPAFFVVNADGTLAYTAVGHGPDSDRKLAAAVEQALRALQPK
ncbi:MAG: TlpA family protein disulfide reductase [Phycisphaerae bacterium]|nr:TlpA family protein disulfide reductase [Phycisphaerae bacterium]